MFLNLVCTDHLRKKFEIIHFVHHRLLLLRTINERTFGVYIGVKEACQVFQESRIKMDHDLKKTKKKANSN